MNKLMIKEIELYLENLSGKEYDTTTIEDDISSQFGWRLKFCDSKIYCGITNIDHRNQYVMKDSFYLVKPKCKQVELSLYYLNNSRELVGIDFNGRQIL